MLRFPMLVFYDMTLQLRRSLFEASTELTNAADNLAIFTTSSVFHDQGSILSEHTMRRASFRNIPEMLVDLLGA